jgi:membrane protein
MWLKVVQGAGAGFWHDNAMGMAGMVAFFGFLSLVPLVLLLLAFLGDVIGGTLSASTVRNLFHELVPGLSQHQFLQSYWEPVRHSRVTTTVLGVISLLMGTTGLHDSVDWAVNRIWRSPRNRSFVIAKLRGLAVILWALAFTLLSLWLAWLWAVVFGMVHGPALVLTGWLSLAPALLLDVAVFAVLYKLTPTTDVDFWPAIVGGVVGATLWEMSRIGFGWWVLEASSYNRVYGPLAASVIVMLWLWISAMTFLFGAELSAAMQRSRRTPAERQERPIVV